MRGGGRCLRLLRREGGVGKLRGGRRERDWGGNGDDFEWCGGSIDAMA